MLAQAPSFKKYPAVRFLTMCFQFLFAVISLVSLIHTQKADKSSYAV